MFGCDVVIDAKNWINWTEIWQIDIKLVDLIFLSVLLFVFICSEILIEIYGWEEKIQFTALHQLTQIVNSKQKHDHGNDNIDIFRILSVPILRWIENLHANAVICNFQVKMQIKLSSMVYCIRYISIDVIGSSFQKLITSLQFLYLSKRRHTQILCLFVHFILTPFSLHLQFNFSHKMQFVVNTLVAIPLHFLWNRGKKIK